MESVEINHLENLEISQIKSADEIVNHIGLISNILIAIFEVWKKIPGKNMVRRNANLDKSIMMFRAASLFNKVKSLN